MYKIPLFKLNYNNKEKTALNNVLRSKWLTMGEETLKLEASFAKYISKDCSAIAVSSCTAALHLSLMSLDLKKNDEVIVPSLSFISQINVINNLGAKPVLIDCISLDNWNMDLSKAIKKINKKTKAIIILHYAGYPSLITQDFINICKKRNILIIEDVAHSPGARLGKIKCGSIGDVGCFSFFSNKNISAGEGGIVVTKNKKIEKKIRYLRSHGMTHLSLDRTRGRVSKYDVLESGLNYRIDEFRSSLALVQLSKLEKSNNLRNSVFKTYKSYLKDLPIKIPFQTLEYNFKAAYHIFPILLPHKINRELFIKKLKEYGIQSSIHYPAFWSFTIYKKLFLKKDFPICDAICKRELTLPMFPNMKKTEIRYVCNILRKILK